MFKNFSLENTWKKLKYKNWNKILLKLYGNIKSY